MTATCMFEVFSSLHGYGSHIGDWGGFWGKQAPELLDHRLALYDQELWMVLWANTRRLDVMRSPQDARGPEPNHDSS